MPRGNAQLNPREVRKRLLIVESELNRQLLSEDGRVFLGKIGTLAEHTANLRELMTLGMSVASAFRSKKNEAEVSGRRSWLQTITNSVRFGTSLLNTFRNGKGRQ
jgi:type II secretory pathway component PulF